MRIFINWLNNYNSSKYLKLYYDNTTLISKTHDKKSNFPENFKIGAPNQLQNIKTGLKSVVGWMCVCYMKLVSPTEFSCTERIVLKFSKFELQIIANIQAQIKIALSTRLKNTNRYYWIHLFILYYRKRFTRPHQRSPAIIRYLM